MATKKHNHDSSPLSEFDTPPVPDGHDREVLTSGPRGEPSTIQTSRVECCDSLYIGYISKRTDDIDRVFVEVETIVATDDDILAGVAGIPPDRKASKYTTDFSLVWYITHDRQSRPVGTAAFLDIPNG